MPLVQQHLNRGVISRSPQHPVPLQAIGPRVADVADQGCIGTQNQQHRRGLRVRAEPVAVKDGLQTGATGFEGRFNKLPGRVAVLHRRAQQFIAVLQNGAGEGLGSQLTALVPPQPVADHGHDPALQATKAGVILVQFAVTDPRNRGDITPHNPPLSPPIDQDTRPQSSARCARERA